MTPYLMGYMSYDLGHGREINPHTPSDDPQSDHQEWLTGWKHAQADRKD